jgi:hypothetical protein
VAKLVEFAGSKCEIRVNFARFAVNLIHNDSHRSLLFRSNFVADLQVRKFPES